MSGKETRRRVVPCLPRIRGRSRGHRPFDVSRLALLCTRSTPRRQRLRFAFPHHAKSSMSATISSPKDASSPASSTPSSSSMRDDALPSLRSCSASPTRLSKSMLLLERENLKTNRATNAARKPNAEQGIYQENQEHYPDPSLASTELPDEQVPSQDGYWVEEADDVGNDRSV